MKTHSHIVWLLSELPRWVESGFITEENALKLQNHYQKEDKSLAILTVFGIIGALLIGFGIILLLAYNWSSLSRTLRTLLSLGLLVLAQMLVGYSLWKKPNSSAWRESTATFLTLAIAACIALIGQTYHIYGNLANYFLACCLLSLPIVYLTKTHLPNILYLIGVLLWYFQRAEQLDQPPDLVFWLLFALALPWVCYNLIKFRYNHATHLLSQFTLIIAYIALALTFADSFLPLYWLEIYACLFACLVLGGPLLFPQATTAWQNLVTGLGGTGLLVLGFLLSSDWFWQDIISESNREAVSFTYSFQAHWLDSLFLLGIVMSWVILVFVHLRQKKEALSLLWGMAPLLMAWGKYLGMDFLLVTLFFMNIWLLVLGVATILAGLNEEQLGKIHRGTLMVALLILLRFIDAEMGLIARGCAFICVGLAFLVFNFWVARYFKGKNQDAKS